MSAVLLVIAVHSMQHTHQDAVIVTAMQWSSPIGGHIAPTWKKGTAQGTCVPVLQHWAKPRFWVFAGHACPMCTVCPHTGFQCRHPVPGYVPGGTCAVCPRTWHVPCAAPTMCPPTGASAACTCMMTCACTDRELVLRRC